MRKRIGALLFAAVMVCTGVPVYAAEDTSIVIADAFPDYDMQLCIAESFDKNSDGVLDADEIGNATELVVDSWTYWVADLTGIEYLTELRKLDAEFSMIDSINVSKNTKLEELNISLTYVDNIDLSNNPELKVFEAQETDITNIDFSKNTKLEEINLIDCKIGELNLDNLTELKKIKADKMPLTALDTSDSAKLENLSLIGATNLTTLDLSNNTALKTLDISGTAITELSLDNNVALEELKSYDRSDVYWKTYNAAPIKGLDLSNNTALKVLYLDGTDLSHLGAIDLTNYPALIKVSLENTELKSIKFNDAVTYEAIYLDRNHLKEADRPAVTEKAKTEWGTQNITVKVPSTDSLETFDLNTLVDISRADVIASEGIEYNAETGIVTFKGENKEFTYKYSLDSSGNYKMDVNVTVVKKTVEEEAAEKEAADKAAAQEVIEKIDAIGEVTLESEDAIEEARVAYDELTEEQKQYVENYSVLEEAEKALEALKTESEDDNDLEEPEEDVDSEEPKEDVDSEESEEEDSDSKEEADKNTAVQTGDTAVVMPYIFSMFAALGVMGKRKFKK